MKKLLLLLLIAIPVYGQGVRFESNVVQSATVAGVPNVLTSVSTASINICTFPASGVPCVNKAATYTSSTITTPCSTAQQLVLPGTNNCVSTTDAQGNWGIWVAAGTYSYTVTIAGVNLGPYTFSVGGAGGGSTISLQTNSVTNPVQTVLNIKQGTGITTAADGAGGVTISNTSPGPQLQTNSVNNGSQNKLNLVAGTNVTLTDDGIGDVSIVAAGGGGGGGNTVGGAGVLQKSDGAGAHVATNATETGTTLNVLDDQHNLGPNPGVDVTVAPYNARPINPNIIPAPTATINASSNSVTVSNPAGFQKNDGIAIAGAGPTQSMSTPAAPTVTPSCASSMTGLGYTVPSGAGSTAYAYSLVQVDKGGGYTAASTNGTTSTGNATLGENTLTISNVVLAGTTFTATVTTTTANLAAGCMFLLNGTTDDAHFGGWHTITAVTGGTTFTYSSGIDAAYGSPTVLTATGGTTYYWLCNHIAYAAATAGAFQDWIFGRTAGSMAFKKVTLPTGFGVSTIGDVGYNTWDDYGAAMSDGIMPPWWAPTTPPVSAVADMWATTITNISGSVLTLANNTACPSGACNSVTASPSRFDDAVGIQAAWNASHSFNDGGGGTIILPAPKEHTAGPAQVFLTSSYLTMYGAVNQGAILTLGDTLEWQGGTWQGLNIDAIRLVNPSFGLQPLININIKGANPGFWFNGNVLGSGGIKNVNIGISGNEYVGVLHTEGQNGHVFENLQFVDDGTGAANGVAFYSLTSALGASFGGIFRNCTFAATGVAQTDGLTATPQFVSKNGTEWEFDYISGGRRGFYFSIAQAGGLEGTFKMGEDWQGGDMPLIIVGNNAGSSPGGWFKIQDSILDTMSHPAIAQINTNGNWSGPVSIDGINQPSSNAPLVSGALFSQVTLNTFAANSLNQIGQNKNITILAYGQPNSPGVYTQNVQIYGPNGAGPKTVNVDSNGNLKSGSRWIASLDPTVGDICAKINHIALTLMPSTGGVIDADGLGSQACATNPWAGVGSIGIKFTSVGTQFLTTAEWAFPPSFAWDCGVQGSGTRGCAIKAVTGFPTGGTAVLEYGTSLIAQSIHVSGLTVDCNNIAGTIGIEDQFAQEGAYANDVTINNCASIGLNLIGTGGGAQNSGTWERINVQTGTSAGASTLCIKMNQVPASIDVKRYTCNMTTNSGTAPNYGIQIDGGGSLDEGQAQSMAVAGVVIGLNSASTSATKVFDLKMNGAPPPTGVIISNAHNVQHVMLFGIQGAGTNNIIDQQPSTPCNSGTSSALGLYILDANDSSNNFNRLSGSNVAGCGMHIGYLGLYTVGLQEATNQYSANHTITTTEGNVIATATSTMTLPHASVGNIWNVFCKAGTCTLTSDGGTLYVNGTTGAYVIPVSQGVTAYCDGTNCYAQAGGGGGGGGGGTIIGSLQYGVGYYSAAGTASTITGTNVGLTGQILTSVNASAPTFSSPSLIDSASSPVTSASYPIACDSGTAMVDRARTVLFQSGASVPTLPDSTGTGCAGMVVKLIDDGAGALVVGRTGSDTFIVINGTSSPAPATSFTLQNGDFATASQNASASWEVTITQNQNLGTPTTLTLTNALGLLCGGLPALSGDTSSPAGTCTTTTTKINGVTMPASADVLGSNSSPGPVAATPHGVSHLLFCIDSSGSGTTQVCNTTPTFSPGAGDMLIYKTGTTNTGSTTINVNSAGAATVKKWQGTANLVAGDLLLNTYNFLLNDGTNWELQTIGNAPGGTTALSAIVAATGTNSISNTTHGAQVWNWALTSNITAMTWGESSASSAGTLGNQYIGQFATAIGSTAVPLNVSNSLNTTQTLPTLHITPTWNTSGVVDAGILLNVTNTASGAASLLADFQVGGTSKWKVDKSGNETAQGTITCVAATCLGSDTATTQSAADNSTKVATTAYVDAHYIANGTSTMGTGGISSGTCATVVTTTATGTATTDVITYTPNTDPTAVTGYAPSAGGSLYIWAYPTSGNVNFRVCNPSSGTITPSALTLNWKVVR